MLIKLVGALGNQMFIYAFAKAMEQKSYEILLDATAYNHTDSIRREGVVFIYLEIASFNLSLPLCKSKHTIASYLPPIFYPMI